MVRFPDVQEKCRREIRNITESSDDFTRIPSQKELPYITATLNEVLRMASVAPTGLPHKARQDTTIDGYHIPKGALIFPNIFFMHLDEKIWESPLEFKPSRWLDAGGCHD
jgi:cytochrome P450